MVAALRSWHVWPSPSMSPRGSFCVFLPQSLPKPWTQLPVYKGLSSLCRPPTCQPVGGTTARAGGQCCHIPLLCKGQPCRHPVQVRATDAEARPGPGPSAPLPVTGCHLRSWASGTVLGSRWVPGILLHPPTLPPSAGPVRAPPLPPPPLHPSRVVPPCWAHMYTLPPETVGTASAVRRAVHFLFLKRGRGSGKHKLKQPENQEGQPPDSPWVTKLSPWVGGVSGRAGLVRWVPGTLHSMAPGCPVLTTPAGSIAVSPALGFPC